MALTESRQVEEVPDGDGDAVSHGREGGPGVEHIGPKVRQLPGFMVAEAGQADSLGYLAGVSAVHPIHIGPDGDLAGLEQRPNRGC